MVRAGHAPTCRITASSASGDQAAQRAFSSTRAGLRRRAELARASRGFTCVEQHRQLCRGDHNIVPSGERQGAGAGAPAGEETEGSPARRRRRRRLSVRRESPGTDVAAAERQALMTVGWRDARLRNPQGGHRLRRWRRRGCRVGPASRRPSWSPCSRACARVPDIAPARGRRRGRSGSAPRVCFSDTPDDPLSTAGRARVGGDLRRILLEDRAHRLDRGRPMERAGP